MKKVLILIVGTLISLCNVSCKTNLTNNSDVAKKLSDSFFESIALNDKYTAKGLLNKDNINSKDKYGVTLLMKSCGAMNYSNINENLYNYDAAILLIENGADVTLTDNKGLSALDYAIKYTQTKFCVNDLVDVLVKAGAPFNLKKSNETISGYSNSFYDYSIIKKLSDIYDFSGTMPFEVWKSIKDEPLNFEEVINLSNSNKKKILFNLCAYSNKSRVKDYLENTGLSIEITDDFGNSLIQICAMTGNINVFEYLIEIVHNHGSSGLTAFQYAALNKHFDFCRMWINKNLDVTLQDCKSLYLCSDNELLEKSFNMANPNKKELESILVNTNEYSTLEYIDTILSFNIDIDCIHDDSTLLERASYCNYEKLVEYALRRGSNPDGTVLKYYPMFCAVSNNNVEIVKLLIKYGANISNAVTYNDGSKEKTPIMIAEYNNNKSMIQVLQGS